MATLFDTLTAHLPMERTHRQMGVENPLLKMALDPMNLAGLGALGAGLGVGMAKAGGRSAAKRAMRESEQRVAQNLLRRNLSGGAAQEGAPVFYSRLARALAQGDPNQRVRTMGDLWKVASKGGGASKGETMLFGERLGAIRPLDQADITGLTGQQAVMLDPAEEAAGAGFNTAEEFLQRAAKPKAPPVPTWTENIPLTAAARARGAKENTVADLLKTMEDSPPLRLETPLQTMSPEMMVDPRYDAYTVPGGTNYQESSMRLPAEAQTTLEQLLQAPGNRGHFPGALNFALTKQRPLAGGAGMAHSLEQVQSDVAQHGSDPLELLQQARPDLAKDLKKRWPEIQMSLEARKAAEEGSEALMWHPGAEVGRYNPQQGRGTETFYGPQDLSSGGRLGDAARRVAKQIPGAEVRPMSVDRPGSMMQDSLSKQFRNQLNDAMSDPSFEMTLYHPTEQGSGVKNIKVSKALSAIADHLADDSDASSYLKDMANDAKILEDGPAFIRRFASRAGSNGRVINPYEVRLQDIPANKRDAFAEAMQMHLDDAYYVQSKAPPQKVKDILDAFKARDDNALWRALGGEEYGNYEFDLVNSGMTQREIDSMLNYYSDGMIPTEIHEAYLKSVHDVFPDEMHALAELNRPQTEELFVEAMDNSLQPQQFATVLSMLGIEMPDQTMQRWGMTLPEESREYLKNNPLRLLGLGGASAVPLSVAASQNRSA